MSEGLFYKKILRTAAIGRLDVPLVGQALADHNSKLIGEMMKVLDEAKQDFPEFTRVHDTDFERIFKEKAYVWDDRKFNPQKISEWFEKWFGEAEK